MEEIIVSRRQRLAITDQTERGWRDRRRRAEELERQREMIRSMVGRILQTVPDGERKGFDLEHWWRRRYPRLGTSLAQGFAEGDRRLPKFSLVTRELELIVLRR